MSHHDPTCAAAEPRRPAGFHRLNPAEQQFMWLVSTGRDPFGPYVGISRKRSDLTKPAGILRGLIRRGLLIRVNDRRRGELTDAGRVALHYFRKGVQL